MVFIESGVGTGARVREKKKPFIKRVESGALQHFLESDLGHKTIHGFIDRVFTHGPSRLFSWDGLENLEALTPHIKNGEKVVVFANHRSLADAAPLVKILTGVRDSAPETLRSIVYTMAGSMKSGEQGPIVQSLFSYGVEPYFAKVDIRPDFVVTKNDRTEREMVRPADNGIITREEMLNSTTVSALHISGVTKEGKFNPERNEFFGVQPMDRGFKAILLNQLDQKIPTVFLPVVVEGGNEFFDPNKKNFTVGGMNSLLEMLTSGEGTRVGNALDAVSRLWFGEVMRYKPGVVKIGEPKTLADLHTRVPELEDNVMRLQAQLTSRRYLGEYGRRLLGQAA